MSTEAQKRHDCFMVSFHRDMRQGKKVQYTHVLLLNFIIFEERYINLSYVTFNMQLDKCRECHKIAITIISI